MFAEIDEMHDEQATGNRKVLKRDGNHALNPHVDSTVVEMQWWFEKGEDRSKFGNQTSPTPFEGSRRGCVGALGPRVSRIRNLVILNGCLHVTNVVVIGLLCITS